MLLEDNYTLLQQNTISILKNYPKFLAILKANANRFDNLQECFNFLCENTSLNTAQGIWLDYIGWLVGQVRDFKIDLADYFCVNSEDINEYKYFLFPNSNIISGNSENLDDAIYLKQIKAKIAYNVSKGTREDLIKIIKNLTNADKVIIQRQAPMILKISLYGENILEYNINDRVQNVLPQGVGLYNNTVTIYGYMDYEDIERNINQIVEMNDMGGVPSNYTYVDIDEDLDEILEI